MKEKALFEAVRQGVNNREAAEHYGITVSRTAMAHCPFHPDKHPSLYVADDHFYCFDCGAHGDVIDFTAKLFGITDRRAARKLTVDFGLKPNPPPSGVLQFSKHWEWSNRFSSSTYFWGFQIKGCENRVNNHGLVNQVHPSVIYGRVIPVHGYVVESTVPPEYSLFGKIGRVPLRTGHRNPKIEPK